MHGVKKILIPTLLILVTAGAAWGIQRIHFLQPGAYFYMTLPTLFLVDIVVATLVIFLGRRIAYSVFFVQLVLGIGLGNYITALGALPSLTTSVQQYSLVSDMGLMAIWDYVNLPLTLLFCAVFFIQCLLGRRLPCRSQGTSSLGYGRSHCFDWPALGCFLASAVWRFDHSS